MMTACGWKSKTWMQDSCSMMRMFNSKSRFFGFVKYKRVVQVGNNEVICSYGVRTVRMMTMLDRVQPYVILQDEMYTLEIMRELISIAQTRQNRFKSRIDDNHSNLTRVRTDLHHKPSDMVQICGFEMREGLHDAASRVRSNQALVNWNDSGGMWNQSLGQASYEVLRASTQKVHGAKGSIKRSFEVLVDPKFEKFLGFFAQDSEDTDKLHNAPTIRRLLKAFWL